MQSRRRATDARSLLAQPQPICHHARSLLPDGARRLAFAIHDIINLQRYPITDLYGERAHMLLTACRRELQTNDLCLLPDFVRKNALQCMLDEARVLVDDAYFTEHWRATPNGAGSSESRLARETRASMGAIAYDRIAADSPLRVLYEWQGLAAFLAAVFDGEPLYPVADPLVACMITVFHTGDELGWHYDPNDGVVSLLLQDCSAGGAFEFAPCIRGGSSPNAADELAVLDGEYSGLISTRAAPGTLSLFNGHRSLHRVSPVDAEPPRIIALFNYAAEPDYTFDEHIHRNFFGRVA